MEYFPPALEKLVEQFARLPGIGHKTAQRLAFFTLSLPEEEVETFASSIREAKKSISLCPVCQNLTEGEGPCAICASVLATSFTQPTVGMIHSSLRMPGRRSARG